MSRIGDPERRCTPVAEWPRADREAWQLAQQEPDPLEPGAGYAQRWKASTRMEIQRGYGRFLGWLVRTGQLGSSDTAGGLVTREVISAYVAALRSQDVGDYSVAVRLAQLGNALRAIAPDRNWDWIALGSARVQANAVPVRDTRQRLRPLGEVLRLGFDLMEAADNDRFRTGRDRATLFRDGLILALLVMRPLRRANLASITLGGSLQKRGDNWRLFFDEDEMKGCDEYGFAWPDDLVASLDRYLDAHRPVLLRSAKGPRREVSALWISRHGGAMGDDAVAYQICSRTKDEFGQAINPHAFRHNAATTIAAEDPGNIIDVAGVLAHRTLRTSEKYYNLARQGEAARSYHQTVKALRRRRPQT